MNGSKRIFTDLQPLFPVLLAFCACVPRPSVTVMVPAPVTAALETPADRLRAEDGRLMPSMAALILNSPSYLEAERITGSPEFRALPRHERKPLQAQWRKIEAEGAVFLREARKLDREGRKLFHRGIKLEKSAGSLSRKRDALNLAIERCRSKCASLDRKARRLEGRIGEHNAGVAKWREEVSGLERRAGVVP